MRRILFIAAALLVLLLSIRFLLLSTMPDVSPSPAAEAAYASNPLPACPETPNCVRTTRVYPLTPDYLFAQAHQAVQAMEPDSTSALPGAYRLHAVFPIFIFKDDFDLAVTPTEQGAALHLRSASRMGQGDWGANARRVARFFEALDAPVNQP